MGIIYWLRKSGDLDQSEPIQIEKETYDLTFEHLSNQLLATGKELNNGKPTISNSQNE